MTKLDDTEFEAVAKDIGPETTFTDIRQAVKATRRAGREVELADATEKATAELGVQQYGVICADPPWRFENRSAKGRDRHADNHYPTMDIHDIMGMPVIDAAHADCVLFLWTTTPMLESAFDVIRAWGFEYRSAWYWEKGKAGTGFWGRDLCEPLLIAVRGKPPAPAPGTQPNNVLHYAKAAHSVKPDEIYDLIASLYPNTPKLEMFARGGRDGWDTWGNEA